MIVKEVMTTRLVTVTPDDTLSHAANLLRQYQFHHLPVVQASPEYNMQKEPQILEGLLTSLDIDLAVAAAQNSGNPTQRPWQERRVIEIMHRGDMRVAPTTSVAAAAQMLIDRGLNCLPVVEYEQGEQQETRTLLVGLLTRSDLLIALERALGAYEPGMQLIVPLPLGDPTPLARMLLLATELHVPIRSVMAAPQEGVGAPMVANVRLGTINPGPLLVRLREAQIGYEFAGSQLEGELHGNP